MTGTHVSTTITEHIGDAWERDVMPSLVEYVRFPCVSVQFDAQWREHGHLHRAMEHIRQWCEARPIDGMSVEVHELDGRTPLLLIDIPEHLPERLTSHDTVVLYGHCDKQPEMSGWRADLGPWKPVVENGRLYGRGGADDGYAAYAALLAVESARTAGLPHSRCVVLIEASEESGSPDLMAYVDHLRDRLGTPSLVICLDSGCLDDRRLWVTTSLRGLVAGTLRVDILREGVHSGEASGIVPSSFRIARQLIERIEDQESGRVKLPRLHVDIPADRKAQIEATANEFRLADNFPWVHGAEPVTGDPVEQMLAQTWQPALSITGAEGMPSVPMAGNVLRPQTSLRLSMRLPPTCDPAIAQQEIETTLTTDPPYGARVQFLDAHHGPGWNAPVFEPWLDAALTDASLAVFGEPWRAFGEGGSIPFMGMLGERFPDAQFVVTGALGPGSNAHGPNEFLDLATARRITACVAMLVNAHGTR